MEEIFPMDVMEEILCYLPVKSLIRFRCVSKSWKWKISEARFIRKHLKQATRPDNTSELELVVQDVAYGAPEDHYCSLCLTTSSDLDSDSDPEPVSVIGIFCPFEHPYMVRFMAKCDELWLIRIRESFYLWNPCMRTYKKLADKPATWQGHKSGWLAGVGYDSVGDDYKVLMASCKDRWTRRTEKVEKETHLYSLKNDGWSKLDESFATFEWRYSPGSPAAKYMNGALHWIIYPFSVDLDYVIVCFNLTNEKYTELPRPPTTRPLHRCAAERDRHARIWAADRRDHDHAGVAVLKGMLCVVLDFLRSQPQQLVLWAMKDYGVADSWTKLREIRYDHTFSPGTITMPRPLYFFDNGDVLIWTDKFTILIYRDHRTPLRTLALHHPVLAFTYAQTLVSPAITP